MSAAYFFCRFHRNCSRIKLINQNLYWQSTLVYVNYGRIEDFKLLVNNMSISVEDNIVIARLGKISSRNMVRGLRLGIRVI